MSASAPSVGVDLYWLPLGAGGHSVRWNGRIFELVAARLDRRDRRDLYHAALEVRVPEARFVIEQAPAWTESAERGVVAQGAVGARALGRFRLFRYEIRLWRDGVIPDIAEAVESPQRLSDDPVGARRLLELVPLVPTAVWGRDELRTGEMWNSNSVISWLIARSGLDVELVQPPVRGRAPGWRAGIVMAHRQQRRAALLRVSDVTPQPLSKPHPTPRLRRDYVVPRSIDGRPAPRARESDRGCRQRAATRLRGRPRGHDGSRAGLSSPLS